MGRFLLLLERNFLQNRKSEKGKNTSAAEKEHTVIPGETGLYKRDFSLNGTKSEEGKNISAAEKDHTVIPGETGFI
jgi:hypothetical protein